MSGFETFINLVEFTIDMDEAQRGCFVVSRRFEPQLGELLQQKEKIRSGMNRQRQKAEEEVVSFSGTSKKTRDVDVVRLIEDNTLGYVLRVTKKDQPAVQVKTASLHDPFHVQAEGVKGGWGGEGRMERCRVFGCGFGW